MGRPAWSKKQEKNRLGLVGESSLRRWQGYRTTGAGVGFVVNFEGRHGMVSLTDRFAPRRSGDLEKLASDQGSLKPAQGFFRYCRTRRRNGFGYIGRYIA